MRTSYFSPRVIYFLVYSILNISLVTADLLITVPVVSVKQFRKDKIFLLEISSFSYYHYSHYLSCYFFKKRAWQYFLGSNKSSKQISHKTQKNPQQKQLHMAQAFMNYSNKCFLPLFSVFYKYN